MRTNPTPTDSGTKAECAEHALCINREQWLTNAVPHLTKIINERTGQVVPPCRVSVGYPNRKKVLGTCFHPDNCRDKQSQIFISAAIDLSLQVLDTLAHELIHVLLPDAKHGKLFVAACQQVGLTKNKPTSASANESLSLELAAIANKLGPFPHVAILGMSKKTTKPTKTVTITDPTTGAVITAPANKLHRLIDPKPESDYAVWVESRFLALEFPKFHGRTMVLVTKEAK